MCHHWKTREAERFVGPFNRTDLANDILVIGNTADVSHTHNRVPRILTNRILQPITPVVNARAVNRMLPQSRLIVQDGSGVSVYLRVSG
jgi:hypothetical protein